MLALQGLAAHPHRLDPQVNMASFLGKASRTSLLGLCSQQRALRIADARSWHQTQHTLTVRCMADTAHLSSQPETVQSKPALGCSAGRIDVIFGPMFAGKSSDLLRRVQALEAAHKQVLLVKSDRDTRYSKNEITTHDGLARPCHAVGLLAELRAVQQYDSANVIAIDEAQFFPDLLEFCTEASDHENKQMLVAGLDGDFRRQRFGQVLDLIPVSDSVTKLKADCAYCGQPALFSLRIAADQRQEVVGGADKYAPVCRHHYVSLSQLRGQ